MSVSSETLDRIRQMLDAGQSQRTIDAALGLVEGTARRVDRARKRGIEYRPKPQWTAEKIERLLLLASQRVPQREIAEELGFSVGTVHHKLADLRRPGMVRHRDRRASAHKRGCAAHLELLYAAMQRGEHLSKGDRP